jgi:hypothetical protein
MQRKLKARRVDFAQTRAHVSQPIFRRVAQKPQGDVQLLGPSAARASYALTQTRDHGSKLGWQIDCDEKP